MLLDRLLSGNDPLERFLGPSRNPRQQGAYDIPELTAEERDSLIRQLASGTMSGLEYVGNALDKPGRAVRGALAGRYDEIANLIPFSDTLGITDERRAVSGRDLLQKFGMVGSNTPGPDRGDVAGFAAEVLLDPLLFISGPGKALTAAGRAAAKAAGTVDNAGRLLGKAVGLTPAAMAREIREGTRGIAQLSIPGIPFISEAIPVGKPFGAGSELAAKAYEKMYYGKYTGLPARALRTVFDGRISESVGGSLDPIVHKAADLGYEAAQNWKASMQGLSMDLSKRHKEAQELYETVMGNKAATTPFDEALRSFAEVKTPISLGDASTYFSHAAGNLDPAKIDEATNAFYGLADQVRNISDLARNDLTSLGYKVPELEDSFIRHIFRQHGGPKSVTDHAKDLLFTSSLPFTLGRLPVLKELPGGTKTVNLIASDPMFTAIRGNRGVFDELIAPLMPANSQIWKNTTKTVKGGKRQRALVLTDEARQVLRDRIRAKYGVPATATDEHVDEMLNYFGTIGPNILKQGEMLASHDNLADALLARGGDPMMTIVHNRKTKEFEVYRPGGLFNRGTLTDTIDFAMHSARAKATMETLHNIVSDPMVVNSNAIGTSLSKLWVKDMKLDPQGLVTMFANMGTPVADANAALAKAASMIVPEDIAKASRRMIQAQKSPEGLNEVIKGIDKYNALFRTLLTLPAPAFHTRNFISGQWANWATDMFSTKSVLDSGRLLKGQTLSDLPDIMDEIKVYEVAGFGRGGAMAKNASNLGGGGGGVVPDRGAFRHIFVDPAKEAWQNKSLHSINPFAVEGAFEGEVRGRKLLGDADKTGFLPARMGENAADVVEWGNRVAPYIELRRRGWSPASAARKVKMVQYDYRELSKFERTAMRRLIPFYGFFRKNLPAQLREIINHPGGRTAQTIRAANVLRENKEGYVPSWLGEGLPIRLGPDNSLHALLSNVPKEESADTSTFISSSGLLPIEEAFNRFPIKGGHLDLQRTLEKFLAQTAAPLSVPAQYATGRQFWSGRQLSDLHEFPSSDPTLNFALGMSPGARAIGTARTLLDPRKTNIAKLLNTLIGGTRVTQVDVPRSMALEGRQLLEDILRQKPKNVGEVSRFYLKPGQDQNEIDPEVMARMSLYQAVMDQLREINKQRKLKEQGAK